MEALTECEQKGLMMREFCTRVLFLYNFTSKRGPDLNVT